MTGFWRLLAVLALAGMPALAQEGNVVLHGGVTLSVPAGGVDRAGGPAVTLQLAEVTDQRCSPDVACYWEGLIHVVLRVQTAGGDSLLALCNAFEDTNRSGVIGGYRFSLLRLDPGKDVILDLGRPAMLTDYTVVLTLVPAGGPAG